MFTSLSQSQDLQAGFNYLEIGAYEKASHFFEDILQEYPSHKTARLCLGRAIGLSGNPQKAKYLFEALLEDYPSDFEIELNFAEALLWNKEYSHAKGTYERLLLTDPNSFSAVLGFANTLSNLKEYDNALLQIEHALHIMPDNKNALISQKYMRLGKAAQLVVQEQFEKAKSILTKNFIEFENDLDTRRAIINIQLQQNDLEGAKRNTLQLGDSIIRLTNLSLIHHKNYQDKKALKCAKEALRFLDNSSNDTAIQMVHERHIQALLWSHKISEAKKELLALEEDYANTVFIYRMKATLGMFTGDLKKSIKNYGLILKQDSTSFDGNLGIANAYKAQGNLPQALTFANKTLSYYPNQPDAIMLIKGLKNSLSPTIDSRATLTSDNGKNESYGLSVEGSIPISHRITARLGYGYRTTENKLSQQMAYNTNVGLGIDYRVLNNTWISSKLGFLKGMAPSTDFKNMNGSLFVRSRPLPLQFLEVGYSRSLQNFNAELIDEQIFMNNFTLNYNMGTNFGLGWYTSVIHTKQTDQNSRNLLFTSVYYNFSKRPFIKGGINYQYLSFKNMRPELYFSPEKYQALEVFAEVSGTVQKLNYRISAAGGLQFLENDMSSTLFRIEAKVGYSVLDKLRASAFAKYSNIASATATGFEYQEAGIQLNYQF
jgi:tetratricopeptide (TPR) repeat protein